MCAFDPAAREALQEFLSEAVRAVEWRVPLKLALNSGLTRGMTLAIEEHSASCVHASENGEA